MTCTILSTTACSNRRRENGEYRSEEMTMNDVFLPAFAPDFARDALHRTAAGGDKPISHPTLVSPIITRFLADSAAYLGINRNAPEHVNAGGEPKGSMQAA